VKTNRLLPMLVALSVMVASAVVFAVDVRVNDGSKSPTLLTAEPHYGELGIDDATGLVLTTPTSLTDIKGSPMAAGESNGVTLSATNGTITVARSGLYRCYAMTQNVTGVNSQALVLQLVKNSTATGAEAEFTQGGTALTIAPGMSVVDIVSLAVGDTIKAQISGSTGNVTIKRFSLGCVQLTDT
jgi:hypothetical protein